MAICNEKLKSVVSSKLKSVRAGWGISKEAMAERLNITPRAYSNLEREKSLCSVPTLLCFLALCCSSVEASGIIAEIKTIYVNESISNNDAA